MAQAGDRYTIVLKKSHLKWGEYRYTNSRGIRCGEGYIPIPARYARAFHLLNKKGTKKTVNCSDVFGLNLFNCTSADGLYSGVLRAQGNSKKGKIHAKQFAGNKDLKALGDWFRAIDADVGDEISVSWTSPTDVVIEKL